MSGVPKYKHRACPCGCGELADECMSQGSALNAFYVSEPPTEERAERRRLEGLRAQVNGKPAEVISQSWRPVTEWDSPEMPPCTADPDEPGSEEFFPDPDAEPPF